MAEVLLEECLQENIDLLRSSTPLLDKTQSGLCRAKNHLNTILSRGRLTVSPFWVLLGHAVVLASLHLGLFTSFQTNKGKSEAVMEVHLCKSISLHFASAVVEQVFLLLPPQPRYLNEALLLMAKVHYVQGRYRDAQGMCARVGLEELTRDDQPTYHLRLLAEAFVIKGTKNL